VSTQGTSGALFRRNVARMSNGKRSRRPLIHGLDPSWEADDPLYGAGGKVGSKSKWLPSPTTPYTSTANATGFDNWLSPWVNVSGSLDLLYVLLCLIGIRGFENLT
jgi:hypothetical protein